MKNVFLPNYFLNLCKRTNTRRVSTKNEGSRTQQYIAAVCGTFKRKFYFLSNNCKSLF